MTILYIIIPIAIILVSFFVLIFLWAVKDGQFDDLETPAHKMLIDDWNENIAAQVDNKEKPQILQTRKNACRAGNTDLTK